jgi:hypothetical protein
VTDYAEISAEPNPLKTIHAITHSTKSAKESATVLFTSEFEAVPDRPLYQGTTSVVPKSPNKIRGFSP